MNDISFETKLLYVLNIELGDLEKVPKDQIGAIARRLAILANKAIFIRDGNKDYKEGRKYPRINLI